MKLKKMPPDVCQRSEGREIRSAINSITTREEIQREIHGRFTPRKEESLVLSSVYRDLRLFGRASRVDSCGSFLEFTLSGDSARLTRASFCRDRLCPMCNWRRSLKVFAQVSKAMDELDRRGYKFLFFTVTLRNCSAKQFPGHMQLLFDGWRFLYHKSPLFRRAVKGSIRSVEVTVNQQQNTYHPHLHCVLAVESSYFQPGPGSVYMTHADLVRLWRKACGLSYDPSVFIEALQDYSKGFKEIAKYSIKGSDYLVGQSSELMQHHVETFLRGLSGRRLFGATGVFARVRRDFGMDDPETGDLLITDGEDLRSDLHQVIVRYSWKMGVYSAD